MFLEIATTLGALVGATLAGCSCRPRRIGVIFGVVLLVLGVPLDRRRTTSRPGDDAPDPLATRLRLDGDLSDAARPRCAYHVQQRARWLRA